MATVQEIRSSMAAQGWQPHQVNKAAAILQSANAVKSDAIKFLDEVVYWGILLSAIIGNFILSLVFIPILLAFDDLSLVVTVAVLAVAFGTLMDVVIREIEHLRRAHLIIPELFIPAIALINIYMIVQLSNKFAVGVGLPTHNPWVVSIMYVCGFILPHFILKWKRNKGHFHGTG